MEITIGSAKHGNVTFIIDDEMSHIIGDWTPRPVSNGSGQIYLQLTKIEGPIRMITYYHRLIMNCPKDMVVDHINSNTLDNRKENLRVCTSQQNNWNISKSKTRICHSKYLGVTWVKSANKWQSSIGNKYLGRFDDEEMAAKAYDTEARKIYGEYAKLNFPNINEKVEGVVRKKKTSKYRGVVLDRKTNKWMVSMMVNGKKYTGGKLFETDKQAAIKYNEMVLEMRDKPEKYLNLID